LLKAFIFQVRHLNQALLIFLTEILRPDILLVIEQISQAAHQRFLCALKALVYYQGSNATFKNHTKRCRQSGAKFQVQHYDQLDFFISIYFIFYYEDPYPTENFRLGNRNTYVYSMLHIHTSVGALSLPIREP